MKKIKYLGIIFIMVSIMLSGCSAGGGNNSSKSTIVPGSSIIPVKKENVTEIKTQKAGEIQLSGILTYINTDEKAMHFIDIDTGTEYEVAYTGGTDIQDKYHKVIAAASLDMGGLYNVTCNKNGKAVTIYGMENEWERWNIEDLQYDEETRKITLGENTTLVYEPFTAVMSSGDKISIAQIVSQDIVDLRGIDNKVYSITVKKGHGYITFTGIDSFIGGYVSIGNEQLFTITDKMITTTREGTYKVEVQKDSLRAEKTVTVEKDQTVRVDFSEYQTHASQMGSIYFSVTPSTAVMKIDGTETDYSQPVSLSYGTHRIVLSANGYQQYTGTLNVSKPYDTIIIDMTSNDGTTASTTGASQKATTKASNESSTTKASSTKASTTKAATATTEADKTSGYSVTVKEPEGAALYVDSVYIGIIPCSFHKAQGNKTITLSKSGYDNVSYNISIANAAGNLSYSFPEMTQTGSSETTTAAEATTAAK